MKDIDRVDSPDARASSGAEKARGQSQVDLRVREEKTVFIIEYRDNPKEEEWRTYGTWSNRYEFETETEAFVSFHKHIPTMSDYDRSCAFRITKETLIRETTRSLQESTNGRAKRRAERRQLK
jgi:hypothetical protein